MAAPVKGQATLDAANARKKTAKEKATGEPSALAVLETHTPESGYEKPKTLRQLENIVESNTVRGAGYWRKAADALLVIRKEKLWKQPKDQDGNQLHASFVSYAESRFGFKKTYAYDLVKAATRKPEADTERGARAEIAAEAGPKPVTRQQAVERMEAAWTKFEDRTGDLRDRVPVEDEAFILSFDLAMQSMGETWRAFLASVVTIEAEAEDVSPLRSPDNADLPGGHDDDDSDTLPED